MRSILSVALLLIAMTVSAWAAQSELVLASGEVVRGEILSETDEVLVVSRVIESKNQEKTIKVTYLKSKIAKITRNIPETSDPAAEYAKRSAAAEDTPEGHLKLVRWCREQKLDREAAEQVNLVLARQPASAEALKHAAELGCVEVDGQWILQSDLDVATGEADESARRKTAARERTNTIVKANQANQAFLEASKRLEKANTRLATLPDAISDARNAVSAGSSDASQAEQNETWARQQSQRATASLNDASRARQEESMKYYREQVAEADRSIQKAQQNRKAALGKQRQAEKQLAALESELAACTKTVDGLQRDIDQLRVTADDAVAQREAAAAAAKKP